MSRKSILKLAVIATVFTLMFVCFAISAMTEATITTTTTYDFNNEQVAVESEIIGAEPGEEVTYLAYKEDTSPENIVYIDQGTAEGGEISFNYRTRYGTGDIGSTIKFGAASFTSPGQDALAPRTLTVNVTGVGSVTVLNHDAITKDTVNKTVGITDEGVVIGFSAQPASVTLNGNTLDVIGNSIPALEQEAGFTDDNTLVVTFGAGEPNIVIGAEGYNNYLGQSEVRLNDQGDVGTRKNILVYGTVDEAGEENPDFGLLVSKDVIDTENLNFGDVLDGSEARNGFADSTVYKFKAYSKGTEGKFAVNIIDKEENSILLSNEYYVVLYFVKGNGEVIYSVRAQFQFRNK